MASVGRRRGQVVVSVDRGEVALLRQVVGEVRALLGTDDTRTDDAGSEDAGSEDADTFRRLVDHLAGPGDPPPTRPSDPALARLLPDCYPDDEGASAEWRRLTEPGLLADKRAAADSLLGDLDVGAGRLILNDEAAGTWLAALNDVRLVLGTRLDVTEEGDPLGGYSQRDPRAHPYLIYHWLTSVQDGLVRALARS